MNFLKYFLVNFDLGPFLPNLYPKRTQMRHFSESSGYRLSIAVCFVFNHTQGLEFEAQINNNNPLKTWPFVGTDI
jgi:hypothetical protein